MKWLQSLDRGSVWFMLVLLTLASFPWNSHWNSIGITCLILHWLFDRHLISKVKNIAMGANFWLYIIFFAINVIYLLGTDNLHAGAQSVEVKLSFLILPILFSSENHINEDRWIVLMNVFTVSCIMSIGVNVAHSLFTYPRAPFGRMELSWTLTHPGLLSNFFFVAATYCLFRLFQKSHKRATKDILLLLAALILIVFCLFLISKTTMLSFAMLFIYMVWMLSAFIRHKALRITSVLTIIGIGTFLFLQLPMIQIRTQETNQNLEQLDKEVRIANSTGSRIVAYQNSWQLIKESFMMGIGTGDANDALKQHLYERGYKKLSTDNMHVHNQFLRTWMEQGIIGVLILITLLAFSLYELVNYNQKWAIWAGILVVLNALTDDVLESQAAAVFFAFIISLCLFSPKKQAISLYH